MDPVNFDSLFTAAEERQRWASSPAQKRRGGTSQGSSGSVNDIQGSSRKLQGSSGSVNDIQGSSRKLQGSAAGSVTDLLQPMGTVQQSRSMPAGDLRHQAIANNLNNRLSPTKKVVRSLRPDSTPQMTRKTNPGPKAGLRRSSSMRDCTEWTRIQNKQKVIFSFSLQHEHPIDKFC